MRDGRGRIGGVAVEAGADCACEFLDCMVGHAVQADKDVEDEHTDESLA